MRFPSFRFALILFLSAYAMQSGAQYPDRPVRVLHPFAVGGGSDLITRIVLDKAGQNTGKAFVVENRTGAGGRVAYDAASKANPDGYTLVTGETTYGILAALYGKSLPWDAERDLVPITVFAQTPFVIVVPPKLNVKTLKEFIELAKANPGKLNYGSAGIGSNNHIFGELFKREAKVDLIHIPYKGMGDAITGLFNGSVDMLVVGTAPVVQHLQNGKLIALAIASPKRSSALPNVPSVVEAGLPGFVVGNWFGLMAPKGTPADIIEWWHQETVRALASPEVKARFLSLGVEPSGMPPLELAALMSEERRRWTEIIRSADIKPE